MKMNVKYESVAAEGAGALKNEKIEHRKFLTQFLKENMEKKLKKTGLIQLDQNIDLEEVSQVNKELDEMLAKSKD